MFRSNLCDYSDIYIVVKGEITARKIMGNNNANKRNKNHPYQKSITHSLTIQKILILLCPCIIC